MGILRRVSSPARLFVPATNCNGAVALFAAIALCCPSFPAPAAAEHVQVKARGQGAAVAIEARATVHASLPVIWNTLTDYDHFADFIPGMNMSRVIERHGTATIIEQQGELHWFFLRFHIDAVIETDEHYPVGIGARTVSGNVKLLDAGYTLEKAPDVETFVIHWAGVVEPQFWTPSFITVPVLRANVEDQFRAMIDEIERRQTVRSRTREG